MRVFDVTHPFGSAISPSPCAAAAQVTFAGEALAEVADGYGLIADGGPWSSLVTFTSDLGEAWRNSTTHNATCVPPCARPCVPPGGRCRRPCGPAREPALRGVSAAGEPVTGFTTANG